MMADDFRKMSFKLLWRDTRDGVEVSDFHIRCDDDANTLLLSRNSHNDINKAFTPAAVRVIYWRALSNRDIQDGFESEEFPFRTGQLSQDSANSIPDGGVRPEQYNRLLFRRRSELQEPAHSQ
jgi:hypothetical protein